MGNTDFFSCTNIRATCFEEFWGDEYDNSIYLWHGAKHKLSLAEIVSSSIATLPDVLLDEAEVSKGHEFCKSAYYKFLPLISRKLNEIHGYDLSLKFWQITIGYFLYRHICIVYEKYNVLKTGDLENTSIKLLDESCYYIPQNHYDYIFCFSGDFGVQQLVSLYYSMFVKKKFKRICKQPPKLFTSVGHSLKERLVRYSKRLFRRLQKKLFDMNYSKNSNLALLDVYATESAFNKLKEISYTEIAEIKLPLSASSVVNKPSFKVRQSLLAITANNDFEKYLVQSLFHCMPADLIENFNEYYRYTLVDLAKMQFKGIMSESWISNIPVSIYCASAREEGRIFIGMEHGSGTYYFDDYMDFIDYDCCDYFMSVGWTKEDSPEILKGSFIAKNIDPYTFSCDKTSILFIGRTKFLYWEEFNLWNATNECFINELSTVDNALTKLCLSFPGNVIFRPRKAHFFWDTDRVLGIAERQLKLDSGNFSESIHKPRIIVINHVSTGIAEILLTNTPFLLLHDKGIFSKKTELQMVLDNLMGCKVLHTSVDSLIEHLNDIYEDVEGWWKSPNVAGHVLELKNLTISHPNNMEAGFLDLLNILKSQSEN